jgi:trehalose synthase
MTLAKIYLGHRRLSDYAGVVAPEELAALRQRARPLAGLRVLHLSAGPFGSAVAETLAALVPLQRDLGILADWRVLRNEVSRVATALYQGIAGADVRWGPRERDAWQDFAARNAAAIAPGYDLIVAHDPQVVALATASPRSAAGPRWVWHGHLDTRAAQPEVWADFRRALSPFAAALFPAPALVRRDLPLPYSALARPAIDPCAPKNLPLPPAAVREHLGRLGVDPDRPLIGQFAPLDARYHPIAALGAYWIARREVPGLQIVLVDLSLEAMQADGRARRDLEGIIEAAAGDPDIHLLTTQAGLGATELNALQTGVSVALQLAVPRGFGWGIAECQWKGKPAVVAAHGLLPEQVEGGQAGVLAEGAADAAGAVVRLLRDPGLAGALGRRGRVRIATAYSMTGLLADYLALLNALTGQAPADRPVATVAAR